MVESFFSDLMRDVGRPALDEFVNLYPLALVIQRLKDVANDDNGEQPKASDDDAWELFAEADAKSDSQAAQEFFAGWVQTRGGQREVFEMLYVEGVTTEMRVIFEGRAFNVVGSGSPGERKVYTFLNCIEWEAARG